VKGTQMALDRGAQVGMVTPTREGAHSQGYIDWVKQNVASSRKIIFQQTAGFIPNSADEEVKVWDYVFPTGLVLVEETVIITLRGFIEGTTGSKQVIIRFGGDDGDILFDTGAIAAETMWDFEMEVIRDTSASVKIYSNGVTGTTVAPVLRTLVPIDPAAPQNIGVYIGPGEPGPSPLDLIRVELLQVYNPAAGY
jgi:hypothetical protein